MSIPTVELSQSGGSIKRSRGRPKGVVETKPRRKGPRFSTTDPYLVDLKQQQDAAIRKRRRGGGSDEEGNMQQWGRKQRVEVEMPPPPVIVLNKAPKKSSTLRNAAVVAGTAIAAVAAEQAVKAALRRLQGGGGGGGGDGGLIDLEGWEDIDQSAPDDSDLDILRAPGYNPDLSGSILGDEEMDIVPALEVSTPRGRVTNRDDYIRRQMRNPDGSYRSASGVFSRVADVGASYADVRRLQQNDYENEIARRSQTLPSPRRTPPSAPPPRRPRATTPPLTPRSLSGSVSGSERRQWVGGRTRPSDAPQPPQWLGEPTSPAPSPARRAQTRIRTGAVVRRPTADILDENTAGGSGGARTGGGLGMSLAKIKKHWASKWKELSPQAKERYKVAGIASGTAFATAMVSAGVGLALGPDEETVGHIQPGQTYWMSPELRAMRREQRGEGLSPCQHMKEAGRHVFELAGDGDHAKAKKELKEMKKHLAEAKEYVASLKWPLNTSP